MEVYAARLRWAEGVMVEVKEGEMVSDLARLPRRSWRWEVQTHILVASLP